MQNEKIVKVFKQNYLTHSKWQHGVIWTLIYIQLCFIFSWLEWSQVWETSASRQLVFVDGQWWRLFTSTFVHGDLRHLLSNGVMLSIMGHFVCSYYSPLIHPFLSFLIGGFINAIVLTSYPLMVTLVGASGVVYYLWGFWLVLYFFIQRHLLISRRLMKVSIVGMVVLVPSTFEPNVSYLAHLVGLIVGVVCGYIVWFIRSGYFRSFEEFEWKSEIEPDFADEAENTQQDQ